MQDTEFSKIRRNWLVSFILIAAVTVAVNCSNYLFLSKLKLAQLTIIFVVSYIKFWAIYEIAYKRRGTILLLLQLIFHPFYILYYTIETCIEYSAHFSPLLLMLVIALMTAPNWYFWVSSLLLRKENMKFKEIKVLVHKAKC